MGGAGAVKKTWLKVGRGIAAWLVTVSLSAPLSAEVYSSTVPEASPMIPPPPGAYRGHPMPPGGMMLRHPLPSDGSPGSGYTGGAPIPPPFAGVRFTDTQRQAIAGIMAEEGDAHRQRIMRMQQARARLNVLFSAEEWDSEAIIAAYDVIVGRQRETIKAMSEVRNRIYGMMSAEQKAQMRSARQPHMESPPVSPQP